MGDVLLGVGGKPFAYDPRTEFGKALTAVESKAGDGILLTLTRWRAGKMDEVILKLPTLGSLLADPKYSKRRNQDPITRSLHAIALLASGNPNYLPLVKKEAEWAADYSARSMQTWHYGYVMMLLSEYVIATGDQSVMPGLLRLAMEAAKGQSAVGSWGHGFAIPDGRLGGYGMMNYAGWDSTGGYLLAYAMPLKKIYLTGKRPSVAPQLDAVASQSLILDGRGWDNKDRSSYWSAWPVGHQSCGNAQR